tara:strand:- start:280 stop:585 length:306 start_codon:yes stop_codon:yes gene_type:complete
MKLKAGSFCPLIKKDCIELKCAWFTQLRGSNPNTGEEIDDWGCAVGWLPVLLVENSQQQRSTGAAVESFRNEMVKANDNNVQVLEKVARLKLVETAAREVN